MPIVNLVDKNLRCEIGFFGSALGTNNFQTISPFTTVGGTVVSTNPNTYGSTFPSWNSNTGGWSNWNPNPSLIPTDSKVVYAFLVWSTAYYPPLNPSFETSTVSNVILTKPNGTTIPITSNSSYSLNYNAGWWQFTHGVEITSFMQDNLYGNYTITGVPTGSVGSSWGLGAWGIYILYENPVFPYRNANLNVSATGYNTSLTISNLVLPVTGPVLARIFLEAVQGDRNYTDSLLLNGSVLSGPFNPSTDFMNSRMVDYTGLALQTKGSLIVETGSTYGDFADQTIINNNTILTNTTTTAVLYQQNSSDWAGVSFLGLLINLNSANVIVSKSVSSPYVYPGDTIIYTLTIKNTGSVDALNLTLIDTLPSEVSFVNNSIKLNSVSYPGNISNLTLPSLSPNGFYTITFSAISNSTLAANTAFSNTFFTSYKFIPTVSTVVDSSIQSNYVTTTVVSSTLTSIKNVDKSYGTVNDILTYTLSVFNSGNADSYNVVFLDTLPQNTTLVTNSLKQDGTSFSYNSFGSILPHTIYANSLSTITYKVLVNSVPVPNPILNSGTFSYTFIVNPLTTPIYALTKSSTSNIATTTINYAKIYSSKIVDKSFTTLNDTITYTVVLFNSGNAPTNQNIFFDTLSSGLSFVNNSFAINNSIVAGANPLLGVDIGTILGYSTVTLTFSALIST